MLADLAFFGIKSLPVSNVPHDIGPASRYPNVLHRRNGALHVRLWIHHSAPDPQVRNKFTLLNFFDDWDVSFDCRFSWLRLMFAVPEIIVASTLSLVMENVAVCSMWFGEWYNFYIVEKESDQGFDEEKRQSGIEVV